VASRPGPGPSFEPPGPGSWTLDTAHFSRPATRFASELFPGPARRGFREATARYGLLLDHIEWAFVQGWAYLCPRPIRSLRDAPQQLTREDWGRLVAWAPALGERLATSARVFEDRRWREEVALWDGQVKPQMRRAHLEVQAVDPRGLEADELRRHLDRCRENLRRAIHRHHSLNVAAVIPTGDFLVHAQEWTGRPSAELVGLVRGEGALALGAGPELAALAEALQGDPAAATRLSSGEEPQAILASLSSWPDPVGPGAVEYLRLVGDWSAGSGFDVGEPRLAEMPNVLVETIRAALAHGGAGAEPQEGAERVAEVRAGVPRGSRRTFDEVLAEACASHRVRDERATYCDVWAYGLARRGILAAGALLADAGALHQPVHLVEADHREMHALLEGGGGPSGAQLAARARHRQAADEDQVPTMLGAPPRTPVPTAWLPAGAARTERAFRAYVAAMSGEAQAAGEGAAVHGLPASAGRYEGSARVVHSASELTRLERGDVLVTRSTTPAFNAVLPLIGAIVTDRGGLLSHAAIVAREYGIPAVVGTGDATRRIPDAARVVVDGTAGQASLLG
jgi:pyruvate,water dikinase